MLISRVWAMPAKWTFDIIPIRGLLLELGVGVGWADPYAGNSRLAQFSNDIRDTGLDALDFLNGFGDGVLRGVLLDPPYSSHQRVVSYGSMGKHVEMTLINDAAARALAPGGVAVSFGWNSNGIGAKRGMVIDSVLLVAHGGHHNDTIVTVEHKL